MSARDTRPPETLAERFWSLARGMDGQEDSDDPVAVVAHVLRVLDALESGQVGENLTANTLNFLALLRQYEVKGDLLYASPEQARGEQVDERSLVFSVGVLLFEKLTGRHPFGAEGNPQRLARIRRGEMASGVNYFPKVPGELRTVLVKAMGPFPEERWSSLAELRTQLEMFLDRARHPEDYSAPRSAQPLPALPDDEPTQILNRRTAQPAVDLARMARLSAARLDTQPATGAAAAETATLPPVAQRRWGGIVAGAAGGAVATALAFWAVWPERPRSAAPPPAPAASAAPGTAAPPPAAQVAEAQVAEAQVAEAQVAEAQVAEAQVAAAQVAEAPVVAAGAHAAARSAAAQPAAAQPAAAQPAAAQLTAAQPAPAQPAAGAPPAPAATAAAATPGASAARTAAASAAPGAAATPPPGASAGSPAAAGASAGAFDLDLGGQNALSAARACIAADRRAQFGASLLFDPKTGLSRNGYFGAGQLGPGERRSRSKALTG